MNRRMLLARLTLLQSELQEVIEDILEEQDTGDFSFHWPTEHHLFTQAFGNNPEYYGKFKLDGRPLPGHEGVDLKAPIGSKIFACADGIVYRVHTDESTHNYGIHVRIDHQNGYKTVYAHLQQPLVRLGQVVCGGQLIGLADDTGNSYGSHLHLTVKYTGATEEGLTTFPGDIIDPTPLLI